MDQDLIAYLDRRFEEAREETRQGFQDTRQRFEKTDRRLDRLEEQGRQNAASFQDLRARVDRLEEQGRLTHVVVEDLRSKIETVAEAVVGLREQQDRFQGEITGLADGQRLFAAAYGTLDRRISALESG